MLTLDHSKADGITKLVSNSRIATAGLKIFGISLFKAALAYFNLDLTVRWDCTRPANDQLQQLKLNQTYDDAEPGNDINKQYYKLKIGYEVKVKKFPCFAINAGTRTFPPRTSAPPCEKWYMRTSAPQVIDREGHLPPQQMYNGGHLPPPIKQREDICPLPSLKHISLLTQERYTNALSSIKNEEWFVSTHRLLI